jgi:hypothetical protein
MQLRANGPRSMIMLLFGGQSARNAESTFAPMHLELHHLDQCGKAPQLNFSTPASRGEISQLQAVCIYSDHDCVRTVNTIHNYPFLRLAVFSAAEL